MLSAGSRAPEFTLREILSQGRVLLVFFKISCPVCQLTLPFLERLKSLRVVAISQDTADNTQRFRSKFGLTMPILLDSEEENYPISNAFGITHVPSLFLIEPDGVISAVSEGFMKADLAAFGVVFGPEEAVPAWKAG